jgi:tetratricopeptide (TPR) repeat protein
MGPGIPGHDASLYLARANAMVDAKDWEGALAVTDAAIAWYPDNADFLCMNGYALRKLGRYEEAVDQVSRAIIPDQKPVLNANRGYSYLALGNYPAALADAESGISRDPAYPASYTVKALALNAMGMNTGALAAIDQAIILSPESAHYWHVKGRILATGGNCTGAKEAFERSLAFDPGYDQPWPGTDPARVDLAILGSTCPPLPDRA